MGKKLDSFKEKVSEKKVKVKQNFKKIEHRLRKIDLFVMGIILAVMVISLFGYVYIQRALTGELLEYGAFGVFAVVFFLELIPQFISPQILLPLSITAGINPHSVLLFAIFGSTLGSLLGFYLGEQYGLSAFKRFLKESQVARFLRLVERYGKVAVFIAAIAPVPYLPIVLGSLGVTRKDFALYGLTPRALGFAVVVYAFYLGFYTPVFV